MLNLTFDVVRTGQKTGSGPDKAPAPARSRQVESLPKACLLRAFMPKIAEPEPDKDQQSKGWAVSTGVEVRSKKTTTADATDRVRPEPYLTETPALKRTWVMCRKG